MAFPCKQTLLKQKKKMAYRETSVCHLFAFYSRGEVSSVNFPVLEIINAVVFADFSNYSVGIANS